MQKMSLCLPKNSKETASPFVQREKEMDEPHTEQDEAEWIRRAQKGDGAAFDALFHAYYSMTFSLAFQLIGRHHDAEEIVQEAFVKAARALPRFRGDCTVKTWLYRIVVNTATDHRRKRRDGLELCDEIAAVPPEKEQHPLTEALWQALARLSHQQRQAVVLTFIEGMTHAEAATVLKCAETTVSWRIFSAKRRLKKFLSKHANGEGGLR